MDRRGKKKGQPEAKSSSPDTEKVVPRLDGDVEYAQLDEGTRKWLDEYTRRKREIRDDLLRETQTDPSKAVEEEQHQAVRTSAEGRLVSLVNEIANREAMLEFNVHFTSDIVADRENYLKWQAEEDARNGEFAGQHVPTKEDLAREREELDNLRAAHRELKEKILVGHGIRSLRRSVELTIDQLAEKARVGRMTIIRYEAGHVAKVWEAAKILAAIEKELGARERTEIAEGAVLDELKSMRERLISLGTITLTEPPPPGVSDLFEEVKKSLVAKGIAPREPHKPVTSAWFDSDMEQFAALIKQLDDPARQELLQYVRGFVSGRRNPYRRGT